MRAMTATLDVTEPIRREMVGNINASVQSDDKDKERKRLENLYGQVWDTQELGKQFEVLEFAAPFCIVRRKCDNKRGSIMFQHSPRFYFSFEEA